ncbi:MAG: hypothetical protein MUC93_11550 [Bacteroidales bacterium]|jgi:predicted GH43/DUF377 family glycosyl hydrolase|nr:hypothetical protein [Bacteroidales bacterium]
MKWIKKGLIFQPGKYNNLQSSHFQCPTAIIIKDRIRVFWGSRDKNQKGQISIVDLNSKNPSKILSFYKTPVLLGGQPGAFDQDGVLPVAIKQNKNEYFLYYGGFSKMKTIPHTCMMGLAISKDGISFDRICEGPIVAIQKDDPFLIGSADIQIHNNIWHMIYTSGTKWLKINGKFEQSYILKYAYSLDGINWIRNNKIAIDKLNDYDAIAKPSIFQYDGIYYMYYSQRSIVNYRKKGENAYSLGLAISKDLINWERVENKDMIGIYTSEEGWDSEMICYPNIIEVEGKYFMFYNGNGFGKSGFGYAELEIN